MGKLTKYKYSNSGRNRKGLDSKLDWLKRPMDSNYRSFTGESGNTHLEAHSLLGLQLCASPDEINQVHSERAEGSNSLVKKKSNEKGYCTVSIIPLQSYLFLITISIVFPGPLLPLWSPPLGKHSSDKWPHIFIPPLYQHAAGKWEPTEMGGSTEGRKWRLWMTDDRSSGPTQVWPIHLSPCPAPSCPSRS